MIADKKILVVDDDLSLLRVMQHLLSEAGYAVRCVTNGNEAFAAQQQDPARVLFVDLRMPDRGGIELLQAVRDFDPQAVMVVITGYPTVTAAVQAMKAGAFDFIQKPVEKNHLLAIAAKAMEHQGLKQENARLRSLVAQQIEFGDVIGKSPAMQAVYERAYRAAPSNATVLIQGETGTGKELVARTMHLRSGRKEMPFITLNCAAIPSALLESELFGHTKGAFTGATVERRGLVEEASGGTLLLDEVGDLPLELQPKLLRLLQEKEFVPVGANKTRKVDVRFMAATHRSLEELVRNGSFREDLFFRLNVVPVSLPPVRERREDIIALFRHFCAEAAREEGRQVPSLPVSVARRLETYAWPGNVREIQNLARRIVALHQEGPIQEDELPENVALVRDLAPVSGVETLPQEGVDLEEWTDRLVLAALDKNDWNQSQTAKFLKISRNSLIYRLEKRPLLRTARQKRESR